MKQDVIIASDDYLVDTTEPSDLMVEFDGNDGISSMSACSCDTGGSSCSSGCSDSGSCTS